MTARGDWPFGAELQRRRVAAGLSAKAAARRTNGAISDGRWYQLESGVQKIKGQAIPIGTTPSTVAAAAKALDWDITDALQLAGFDPRDYSEPATTEKPVYLSQLSVDELLDEVRRRAAAQDWRRIVPGSPGDVFPPLGQDRNSGPPGA